MTTTRTKDQYRLYLASLERDHDAVHDALDQLETVVTGSGYDGERSDRAFATLINHVRAHFKREEGLMRVSDYPGTDAHADQHRNLIAAIEAYHAAYRTNRTFEEGRMVHDLIRGWLTDHTVHSDEIIASHLAGRAE